MTYDLPNINLNIILTRSALDYTVSLTCYSKGNLFPIIHGTCLVRYNYSPTLDISILAFVGQEIILPLPPLFHVSLSHKPSTKGGLYSRSLSQSPYESPPSLTQS